MNILPEKMDADLQSVNKGMHVKVERFENDETRFQNLNDQHCFETTDSDIKIEIDDNEKHLRNKYSPDTQQNDDNIHISKDVDNNSQKNGNVDDKLAEIINIKQEIQYHEEQISYLKQILNVKMSKLTTIEKSDLAIKTEIHTSDLESGGYNHEKNNTDMTDADNSNVDLKPEIGSENIESSCSTCFIGIDLKTKNNDSNIDNCDLTIRKTDLNSQKFTSGNETVEFEKGCSSTHPIESGDRNNNLDITQNDGNFDLQERISRDESNIGNSDLLHTSKFIRCSDCENGFKTMYELRQHLISCRSMQSYQCDEENHAVIQSTKLPHQCNKCPKEFKTLYELSSHTCMICHTIEMPLHSNDSGEGFRFRPMNQLESDKICDSTERPHQCEICDKRFKIKRDLRCHMVRHSTDRPYPCNMCEKSFKVFHDLKKHILTHCTKTPHQCDICEKGFKTIRHLKQHLITHSTEKPHLCTKCGKGFKRIVNLRTHIMTHSTEKSHQCDICNKEFKAMKYLKRHLTSHLTEKSHKCDICEKGFTTPAKLRRHMADHTSDRPYQCSVCSKVFISTYKLDRHMFSHSTERPHKCNVCDKGFKRKHELKQHMTNHSTEKSHKCNICGKGFKCENQLRRHMLSHNIETSHKCQVCEKGFKTLSELVQHMIAHSTEVEHSQG